MKWIYSLNIIIFLFSTKLCLSADYVKQWEGNITKDTTWSGIIVTKGRINIGKNATLTILPGTIIKNHGTKLNVYGQIIAKSSSPDSIIFTSIKDDSFGGDTNKDQKKSTPAPGDWVGIYFRNGSSGELSNIRVSYGGENDGKPPYSNISVRGGYLNISNSTITNSRGPAIDLGKGSCFSDLENLTLLNNPMNGVHLQGCIIDRDVILKSEIPYVINGNIKVHDNATLRIQPGTVIRALKNAGIHVYGRLISEGNKNKPVLLTSVRDNEKGFILNASYEQPKPGTWQGVTIFSNSIGSWLKDTKIKYAGSTWGRGEGISGSIYIHSPYTVIENVKITDNAGAGLSIVNNSPVITDDNLSNNLKSCSQGSIENHYLKVHNPTCSQLTDSYIYRHLIPKFYSAQNRLIAAKRKKAIDQHEMAQMAIEIGSAVLSVVDTKDTALRILNGAYGTPTTMFNLIPSRRRSPKKFTKEFVNLVSTVIVSGTEQAIKGSVSPVGTIATGITKIGNDLVATFREDQRTEERNGLRIIDKYLQSLHQFGGDHPAVAKSYGLSPRANIDDVIHEIAKELNLSGGLKDGKIDKEYRVKNIKKSIKHFKRELIWKIFFVKLAEKYQHAQNKRTISSHKLEFEKKTTSVERRSSISDYQYVVVKPTVFVNKVARFFHATFFAVLPDWRSFGGFSQTSLIGAQFRVSPDQRSGRACFAVS